MAVILRFVEMFNKKKQQFTGVIKLQPLESSLVVLGYGAIVVNFIFHFIIIILILSKTKNQIPRWIIWANFLFFIAQIYYFFFSE